MGYGADRPSIFRCRTFVIRILPFPHGARIRIVKYIFTANILFTTCTSVCKGFEYTGVCAVRRFDDRILHSIWSNGRSLCWLISFRKRRFVSVSLLAFVASAMTFLMYIGKMILLHGHLYRFGTGFPFDGIPGIAFDPVDLLTIAVSGYVTALLFSLVHRNRHKQKRQIDADYRMRHPTRLYDLARCLVRFMLSKPLS